MLLLSGVYAGVTPETERRHKGSKEQRWGPIKNDAVMKQEQDIATRGDIWMGAKWKEKTSGQRDTTSQSGRHMKEDTKRETPVEPDNTGQNGRCH